MVKKFWSNSNQNLVIFIRSCELASILIYLIKYLYLFSVSHTTDDLIFIWDPQMPLDVDKGIELPQLELISTKNDDCTTVYSTGKLLSVCLLF